MRPPSNRKSNPHHPHLLCAYTIHMNKAQVASLAQSLLDRHGFGHLSLTFSNTRKSLGRCFSMGGVPVRIDLSNYWMTRLPEDKVKDTILHELAHAKAGHAAGHGYLWKRAARELGANPNRTASLPEELHLSVTSEISKYRATCQKCGQTHYFNRMGRRWQVGAYACRCGGKLTVEENR